MRTSTTFGNVFRLVAAAGALALTTAGALATHQPAKGQPSTGGKSAADQPVPGAPDLSPLYKLQIELRQVWARMAPDQRQIIRAMGVTENGEFTRPLTSVEYETVVKFIGNATPGRPAQGGLRAPLNDLCAGAIDLGTLGFAAGATINVNADDTAATADGLAACGVGVTAALGGNGIWYTLLGTGNRITVSSCQQATDFVSRVYCGTCATGTWSCVGGDDDGCVTNSLGTAMTFCSVAGQQYYVLMSRFTAGAGGLYIFTVSDNNIACAATQQASCAGVAPVNNDCGSAIAVAIGSSYAGTLAGATAEVPAIPACTVVVTNAGVWHSIVGDGTILRVKTCNTATGGNTDVAVYSGACGALVCVGGNQVTACTNPRDDTAQVDFTSILGTPYLIFISGESTVALGAGAVDYDLSIASIGTPAANDLCGSAITVAVGGTSGALNNFGSTSDTIPTCNALVTAFNGVWFKVVGNGNVLRATTCSANTAFDTTLTVLTGTCGALICVGGNATAVPACAAPANAAAVNFCSVLGQDYFVLVSSAVSGTTGSLEMSVSDLGICPANDGCATAISVAVGASSGTVNNNGATNDAIPTCGGITTANNGVWFKVTGNGNVLRATTCSANTVIDTSLTVLTGTCAVLACVDGNATASPACTPANAAAVQFCSQLGQDYFILVSSGVAGTTGNFEMSISDLGPLCPPNDACGGATVVTTGVLYTGDSTYASADGPANSTITNGCTATIHSALNRTVWHKFTPGAGGNYTFSLCASNFNTLMTIYPNTGTPCSGTVAAIACNDDSCGTFSSIATALTAAQEYYIRISGGGATTAVGIYKLLITGPDGPPPPANDDICSAAVLTDGSTLSGTLVGATMPVTPPGATCSTPTTNGNDVWYTFTPTLAGTATFKVCANLDTVLTAYTAAGGLCTGALTLLGTCNDDTVAGGCALHGSLITVTVAAGTQYWVRVAGVNPGTLIPEFGDFTINARLPQPAPGNDTCATAVLLSVPSTTVVSNNSATTDTGAPTCTTVLGTAGVWYKVIGNGNMFVADTCSNANGNFDTRISVYCGYNANCASLATLGCITGIDNATLAPPNGCGNTPQGATSQQSRVNWCTQVGTPYLILIHGGTGTQGAQGTTTLTLQDTGVCAGALACAATGACCNNGACVVTTLAGCAGGYMGDGTTCFPPTGATTTYTSNPNLAIPDNQCTAGFVTDVQNIADTYTIGDVNIRVAIPAHTFIGDLRINIIHNATTVVLWLNQCGGDDGLDITFDDEGVAVVCAVGAGVLTTGTFKPQGLLSAFDGGSVTGAWTLQVCDSAGADIGNVTTWSVIATAAGPNPCPTPDCFRHGPNTGDGACSIPTGTNQVHTRTANAGHFSMGGSDAGLDTTQCIGDWDGDGCSTPADVAGFVAAWFYSASNPPNLDGDLDCSGVADPADVAGFVTHWFNGLNTPASEGCV